MVVSKGGVAWPCVCWVWLRDASIPDQSRVRATSARAIMSSTASLIPVQSSEVVVDEDGSVVLPVSVETEAWCGCCSMSPSFMAFRLGGRTVSCDGCVGWSRGRECWRDLSSTLLCLVMHDINLVFQLFKTKHGVVQGLVWKDTIAEYIASAAEITAFLCSCWKQGSSSRGGGAATRAAPFARR